MCNSQNRGWGTWEFSDSSRGELKSLTALFSCQSSHPLKCKHLNRKSWRFIVDRTKAEKSPELDRTSVNVSETVSVCHSRESNVESEHQEDNYCETELYDEARESSPTFVLQELEEDDDEIVKITGDICDVLKKEPMPGLSSQVEGNEVGKVLLTIKKNLLDEESIANLLLSVCPPVEENLLAQSRWAPALYQHIILPKILERTSPVPRVLSAAISQVAASSPDACVQLFCIPLLMSPNVLSGSSNLMQPAIDMLMKIIEDSLPPQQKVSFFRAFYKEVLHQSKVSIREDLFPLLQVLAESEGAFNGADSEVLSNVVDWLEMCSQECAASIKFTKYLVAVLKGMAQDFNSRKDGNTNYLTAEEKVKLRNIVSENKTFLRKIAEKSLEALL